MKRITALLMGLIFAASAQAQLVNRVMGPGTIDVKGSEQVNIEGQKNTYFASLGNNTPAATPTDVAILTGATGKIVKVTKVRVTVQATTGAIGEYRLMKYSGGTQSAVNTVFANATHSGPMDSGDAASSVIAGGLSGVYTANPASSGTTVGIIEDWTISTPTAVNGYAVLEYNCTRPSKCITLRGLTQILAVNGNGHALATAEKFGVSFEWTEE